MLVRGRDASNGGGFAPGGPPLGNSAKSYSAPPPVDPETGEIFPADWEPSSSTKDPTDARRERYSLQSVAAEIMGPYSRVAKCQRLRTTKGSEGVDVLRSREHGTCSYAGLQTCGSVWACPVCAAKISERRRAEIQAAMEAWKARGGAVLLLTLTHPHTRHDALKDLVKAEQHAMKLFKGSRAAKRLLAALGVRGQIRAWEVTHGRKRETSHGWHPHFHILLFVEREFSRAELAELEAQALAVWSRSCETAGLAVPSARYGVRLDDGSEAAAYVAKMGLEDARTWGVDCEMTKGHVKRAKDGETPFDLLRSVEADPDDSQGRALFAEYAKVFRGKRQLVWSKGLRDLLDLGDEASDEEHAAAQDGDAELVGTLSLEQWRVVLLCDARGEVLELARESWLFVLRFIEGLEPLAQKIERSMKPQGVRDG